MAVRRIVPDVMVDDPARAAGFYGDILGLTKLMDQGFVVTWGVGRGSPVQVTFATEGGSGAPVPDLSVEVDEVDAALAAARAAGTEIVYGPADEPWGVRRFFARDPFGRVVNLLSHVR